MNAMSWTRTRWLAIATVALVALLAFSGWNPYDRGTWLMEVAPILIALPVLWPTYRRFPLTTLLYVCIFVQATILMLGGAYTYARVPLGYWIQGLFDLSRNPYDKVGHFAQGFVPALVAREILMRGGTSGAPDDGLPGRLRRDGHQRDLRVRGVGRGARAGPGGGRVPGDAGRPLGHAIGHAVRADRRVTALALFSRLHDREIEALRPE